MAVGHSKGDVMNLYLPSAVATCKDVIVSSLVECPKAPWQIEHELFHMGWSTQLGEVALQEMLDSGEVTMVCGELRHG